MVPLTLHVANNSVSFTHEWMLDLGGGDPTARTVSRTPAATLRAPPPAPIAWVDGVMQTGTLLPQQAASLTLRVAFAAPGVYDLARCRLFRFTPNGPDGVLVQPPAAQQLIHIMAA